MFNELLIFPGTILQVSDTDVYRRRSPVQSRLCQRRTSRWCRRHRDKTSSRGYTGTWHCCCTSSTWLTQRRWRRPLVDRSQQLSTHSAFTT